MINLCTSVFKLNALFSFEFLVLAAAVALLAYVSKQQLGKWYRYGAAFIVAAMAAIIICTGVNVFCRCDGGYGCGKAGAKVCAKEKRCCDGCKGDAYEYGHHKSKCQKSKCSHAEKKGEKSEEHPGEGEEHSDSIEVKE